jgi:hypothetical protein
MRGGSWVRRSVVSGGEQAEPTRVDYANISEKSQIRKINHGYAQESAPLPTILNDRSAIAA